jgi:tetratricopeptide (TPR) repeat protein
MRAVLLFLLLMTLVFAKENKTISHQTYEKVQEIQKLLSEEKVEIALERLKVHNTKIDNNRTSTYEKAFVKRLFGYLFLAKEDYESAIYFFNTAFMMQAFESKEQNELLKNIAQLYMAQNSYQKAIIYYKQYLENMPGKHPKVYISLASAHSELNQIDQAFEYVQKAIKSDKEPKRSWYEMLLALYYMKEDMPNSIKTQELIIDKFGTKKSYMMTLSSLYQYTNQFKEALVVLESAYDRGYLSKHDEYIRLAFLSLEHATPHKAATLLQKGIVSGVVKKDKESLRLLADAFSMAREDELALKYFIELADLTKDANTYAQVAQIYLNSESYKKSIEYFQKALQSEGLKNHGGVYLLMGISYYEMGDRLSALKMLRKAKEYDKTKKSANEWLKHLS